MGYYNTGFYARKADVDAAYNQGLYNEGSKDGREEARAQKTIENAPRPERILILGRSSNQQPNTPYGRGFIAGFNSVMDDRRAAAQSNKEGS